MKAKNNEIKQKNRINPGSFSMDLPQAKWLLAGILLITFIAFANTLKNDFITNWDDNTYIINNNDIKNLSFEGIKNLLTGYHIGNYHPLTMLSFAIEYKLFGLNPRAFHFFNLLFHLINVWLVYRFIILLSKRTEVAAIVAVLFAIHPMHVESVSWISERKDVLYAMFYLASLITYLKYTNSNQKKYLNYSVLFFLLSLLSKSMAVTLPAILILLDYYLDRKPERKTIIEKIPYILLSLVFGLLALKSQGESGAISLAPQFELFDRLFIAGNALLTYCVKLILPINLSAMYDYPVKTNDLLPWIYYLSPFILIAIFLAIIKISTNRKDTIFGTLFFLSTISLVIQVIPFGRAIVADRYTYIPYIGLFYIIGQFYCVIIDSKTDILKRLKPYIKNTAIGIALLLAVLTLNRNKVWKNGLTLFEDVIKKNPNIGYAYFARAEAKDDIKDYHGAISDFTEAIRFDPTFMDAYLNRGVMRHYVGDNPGAIADFTKAIELNPGNAALYMNRGLCKLDLRSRQEACLDFEKAASLNFKSAYKMIEKHCK